MDKSANATPRRNRAPLPRVDGRMVPDCIRIAPKPHTGKCLSKVHRQYMHYTNLDAVCGILESGFLLLSNNDDVNDKGEARICGASEKYWMACFSTGTDERVALWALYGKCRLDAMRLQIGGGYLQQWVRNAARRSNGKPGQIHDLYWIPDDPGGRPDFSAKEPVSANLYTIELVDVMYFSPGRTKERRIVWVNDNKYMFYGDVQKPDIGCFVKNVGWQYEKESRIVVRFKEAGSHHSENGRYGLNLFPDEAENNDDVDILKGPWWNSESDRKLKLLGNKQKLMMKFPKLKQRIENAGVSKDAESIHTGRINFNLCFTRDCPYYRAKDCPKNGAGK